MKNEAYQVESYSSRWVIGGGWAWKDEPISDTEDITPEVAEIIIDALRTGKGAWAVWSDVIGVEAGREYEETDWDRAEMDDQYTIAIYKVAPDGESREEVYHKSIWASDWARS